MPITASNLPIDRYGDRGPQLLWLHGLDGPDADLETLQALGKTCRVIAPTLPGFDDSERPTDVDDVNDLALLCLQLLESEGLDEVVVVGHSFGGWVAAEMAVWRPDRIAKLVLIDALGIRVGGPEDRDISDLFVISAQQRRELLFADPAKAGPLAAELDDDDLLRRMRSEEAAALYGWEPYMCNPKLRGRLSTVRLPSYVIWGADDRMVDPAYGRAFADALPNSSFEVIADAGHSPHIEQRRTVVDLIAHIAASSEHVVAGSSSTAQ